MPRFLLAGVLFLLTLQGTAQALRITGRVTDSLRPLPYATISLVKAADSTLVSFTLADSTGRFALNKVFPGSYLLSISYTGYIPVWQLLHHLPVSGSYDAGDIILSNIGQLRAAQVLAKRPPVEINNDTIEFNTENFKTQPNAVVEDMLKKMPGVTVDNDGTIKVNGQTVRRILVNGKEFFTGDIKMATKNLNADAVDKVQVFDRKSDQSSFTGVDDGNSEKTINLKLKKDHNFASFGKIAAGVGGGGGDKAIRFDAQTNINKFKGEEQLSFIGMANNTNSQGFSLMDVLNFTGELARGMRNGGGGIHIQTSDAGISNGLPVTGLGQNQQGIAQTTAGGINYNNVWDKGRTSVNANYTISNIRLQTNLQSYTQNPGSGMATVGTPGTATGYNTADTSHTTSEITQHRFGMILEQQVDSSFSFKVTPTFAWQHTTKNVLDHYVSATTDGNLLNDGLNNNGSGPGAFNTNNELLLRKRLAKKGRTLSGDFTFAYNHSTLGGSQLSDNIFYEGAPGPVDSTIDQQYHRDAVTHSLGGNLTYTEPIGRLSLLAISSFANVNTGTSSKFSFDHDRSSGKYDLPDSALSNHFGSDYRYYGGGLSFRSNQHKFSITTGLTFQAATLNAMDLSAGTTIKQSFADLLPNVVLQYNFSKTKNLRLDYNTNTTQPSVAQLQPVPDLSNPLVVSTGNPGLKRSYDQSLSLNYFVADPVTRTSLLFLLSLSDAANAIVQSDSVTAYGTRFTHPVNANGVGNLFTNIEYNFPLARVHSRLSLGGFLSYSKNADFINGSADDVRSLTVRPNLTYNYTPNDNWDLDLTASVSFYSGSYSLQPELNASYQRQNYGVNLTNAVGRWSFHHEFDYILNTGRTAGFNTSIPLWNVSVARTFLKNDRVELKLSVMDLLDKNTGITRSINPGSIVDQSYNVLQRYFLLTCTYSLNKSGLKQKGGPKMNIRTIER